MKDKIRNEVMKVYDQEASVDEVVDKLLVIFSVMQAEGSDGAKGAAVGNSAAGQSGSVVKVKTGTIVFCEGEQFVFGINRKTGKPECFNLYGMSGISDEGALPR